MNDYPHNQLRLNTRPPVVSPPPAGFVDMKFDAELGAIKVTNAEGVEVPFSAPTKGVTDGSNAPSGVVGEFVTAESTLSAVTNEAVKTVVSIQVTPGDWDVFGNVVCTVDTPVTSVIQIREDTQPPDETPGAVDVVTLIDGLGSGGVGNSQVLPSVRVSVTATTTLRVQLKAYFSEGELLIAGRLSARRVR